MLESLREQGIDAVFHYVPLHKSPMGRRHGRFGELPVTEDCAARLIRLPFYYQITLDQQQRVVEQIERILDGRRVSMSRGPAGDGET